MQRVNRNNTGMGYLEKVLAGFSSQTLLKLVGNALVLVKMMVLARLLGPTEFGIYSLVMIALGISESVTQTGVNLTILQSKHSVSYFLNTAWVIAICRGFLISLLMIALGWGMQIYFKQSELFFLITIASLVPAIKGFINPAIIDLHKSLSFWSDAAYRFSLTAMETVLAIGLVWWGRSVSVWVLSLVGVAVFEVVISFLFFKLRPRFEYLSSRAEIIFKNATWLSLSSILSYLNENLDNLIIGKILGTFSLGLYQNSYAVSHELNYEISKSLHHGTLPVYTRLVSEPVRWRRAVMKTMVFGLALAMVASLPLFAFPRELVLLVFGDQWLESIPTIRVMLLAGWLQSITMLSYTVLYAKNSLKTLNWHQALSLMLLVTLMPWWSQHWGLVGAVWALVVSRAVPMPYLAWRVKQLLDKV